MRRHRLGGSGRRELRGCRLRGCRLRGCRLRGCRLRGSGKWELRRHRLRRPGRRERRGSGARHLVRRATRWYWRVRRLWMHRCCPPLGPDESRRSSVPAPDVTAYPKACTTDLDAGLATVLTRRLALARRLALGGPAFFTRRLCLGAAAPFARRLGLGAAAAVTRRSARRRNTVAVAVSPRPGQS
ncbi:pentapeptide repeat-containing protein [Rugosimonospora africana]|uniref:pentapeptide repeat-containing protein n=1 Tax=Rugosimonospora africana TaxID=556532 RepID=UPI001942289E